MFNFYMETLLLYLNVKILQAMMNKHENMPGCLAYGFLCGDSVLRIGWSEHLFCEQWLD